VHARQTALTLDIAVKWARDFVFQVQVFCLRLGEMSEKSYLIEEHGDCDEMRKVGV
jgi:hypothetical protein